MKLTHSIVISLLIHMVVLILLFWQKPETKPIVPVHKGNAMRPLSFSLWSRQGNTKPKKKKQKPEKSETQDARSKPLVQGNLTQEISRFKNSLHYPEAAIEQGLESECTWQVEVNPEGKAKNIRTLKPCLYNIFEKEFRRSIRTWKFSLQAGTRLTIPVSFILEK